MKGLQGGFIWEWLDHGIKTEGLPRPGILGVRRRLRRRAQRQELHHRRPGVARPHAAPGDARGEEADAAGRRRGVAASRRGRFRIRNKQHFAGLGWLAGLRGSSASTAASSSADACRGSTPGPAERRTSTLELRGPSSGRRGGFLTFRFVTARDSLGAQRARGRLGAVRAACEAAKRRRRAGSRRPRHRRVTATRSRICGRGVPHRLRPRERPHPRVGDRRRAAARRRARSASSGARRRTTTA